MTQAAARTKQNILTFAPQPRQALFLANDADIALYGGAAGSGKSYAALLDPLRYIGNPGFTGVILRRTYPELRNPGGLVDKSYEVYSPAGGVLKESTLDWHFPSGARISFRHCQHDKDVYKFQGSELTYIGLDEATHFSEKQFWYLLSRNRSMCGIRPHVRATCNPDADSWLAQFIAWWIDESGFPVASRAARKRWFVRVGGEVVWGDSARELAESYPDLRPRSFVFIPAKITDNPALLERDPGYLANLMAQHPVERARLLDGNWKIRHDAGKFVNRGWFEMLPSGDIPRGGTECRFWDFAATEKQTKGQDPDWTVGVKMRMVGDRAYIVDVIRLRANPAEVERTVVNTAKADGRECLVGLEQEPGSAGKMQAERWRSLLSGHALRVSKPTANKLERAKPFAIAAEAGRVSVAIAPWNDAFLSVLHAVPDGAHDDDLDAAAGAWTVLSQGSPDWGQSRAYW